MRYGSDPGATQGKKKSKSWARNPNRFKRREKNIIILDCFGFGLWTGLNPNPNQTRPGLV
jgi:hypothetical protein